MCLDLKNQDMDIRVYKEFHVNVIMSNNPHLHSLRLPKYDHDQETVPSLSTLFLKAGTQIIVWRESYLLQVRRQRVSWCLS